MNNKEPIRLFVLFTAVLAMALSANPSCQAQTPAKPSTSTESSSGFTEIESFQGTVNSSERLFKLDSTIGWDFNRHFGVFGGVPIYFVNVPATTITSGTTTTTLPGVSNNGLGNVYLGLNFRAPNPTLNYVGEITAGAPTGSTTRGLSSGRGTFDLDNRIDHSFNRLTPFLEAGIGNTVPDSRLFTRAFTSLGFIAHLDEGAEFRLFRRVSVGGSAYEIVPAGNQKVFSRLVAKGGAAQGAGKHGRVFETAAEASGNGLTRENGSSAFVAFDPSPVWRLELGYTRSLTFDLSSFAFDLRMNVGRLLRPKNGS
jgi:hypothetical protein